MAASHFTPLMLVAGAIAAYLVKNRQQLTNSNRQLVNIAGIVAANVVLGLGGGNIDNAGKSGHATPFWHNALC